MIQTNSDISGVYSPTQLNYLSSVMRGDITGASSFSTNGERDLTGASVNAPITSVEAVNIPISTGVRMAFTGGAQDSPSGTGIGYVVVNHIRADFTEQVEIVTLNATTPVLSSITDTVFINDITAYSHTTAYPPGNNTGFASANITVTNGGITYALILLGKRRQHSSYKMIPKGKVFIPKIILASSVSGSGGTAIFFPVFRSTTSPFFIPSNSVAIQDGTISISLEEGRKITAGTIMGVEVTTSKAASCSASFIGYLENE